MDQAGSVPPFVSHLGVEVQAFPVRLPSGAVYWTVLDEGLAVVVEADAYLYQLRFGRDAAESTAAAYARALALYLGWCARTGWRWSSAEQLGSFITWLQHTLADSDRRVAAGPGVRPVRGERRVNLILTVVREFLRYGVEVGTVPARVLSRLYTISDDRHLPAEVRGDRSQLRYLARPRHRLREPDAPVDNATDEEVLALLGAGRSARDRLIIVCRNYFRWQGFEDERRAAQLAGGEAADGLIELDDDVLAGPSGHRPGLAVEVVGLGMVVDADPVADPQVGQCCHRLGGGQQPGALGDDRAEHAELAVQLPAGDRLDHGLDQVGWGSRGAGRLRRGASGTMRHDRVGVYPALTAVPAGSALAATGRPRTAGAAPPAGSPAACGRWPGRSAAGRTPRRRAPCAVVPGSLRRRCAGDERPRSSTALPGWWWAVSRPGTAGASSPSCATGSSWTWCACSPCWSVVPASKKTSPATSPTPKTRS